LVSLGELVSDSIVPQARTAIAVVAPAVSQIILIDIFLIGLYLLVVGWFVATVRLTFVSIYQLV